MGNQTSVGDDKWSNDQVKAAYHIDLSAAKISEKYRKNYSGLKIFQNSLIRCHLPKSSNGRKKFEAELQAADPSSYWAIIATMACRAPEEKKKRDDKFVAQIEPLKFFSHGVYDRCRALEDDSRSNCISLGLLVKEVEKMHITAEDKNKIVHEKTLNASATKSDLKQIFEKSESSKKFWIPPLPFNWSDYSREQTKNNIDLMTDRTMEELRSKFFRVHFGNTIPIHNWGLPDYDYE